MAFPLSWREKNQALDNEQNIGSLLDGCEPFVALIPDTVQNLNLAVTGNQYNELFASLLTGVELVYPEKYLELIALFLQAAQCSPILPSENECYEYPSYAPFISYEPTSPFIDNGFSIIYPVAPFFLWSAIDTWLPNWIDDLFFGLISNATGYQDNDILISYLSQPLIANPFNGLDYPEIQIHVNGEGTARIHLLQIPYGGRAIISVDDPPDLTDLASAIFTDNDRIIELNRDFTSFPPETDVDTIEDIEIVGEGEHTIYISFVPTIDFDNALFLQFGGGFRSVELCGFGQSGVIMGITDMRRVGEKLEVFDNGVWLEKVDLAPLHTGLQNQITANDNDITALQNVDANLQNQITENANNINLNDIDIATLYLEDANQQIEIDALALGQQQQQLTINQSVSDITSHDNRITALENLPSVSGSASVLTSEYVGTFGGSPSNSTTVFEDIITNISHTFTYPNALILSGAITRNNANYKSAIILNVNGILGGHIAKMQGTSFQFVHISETFNFLPVGLPLGISLQHKTVNAAGASQIQTGQTILFTIIEYPNAPLILNSPLIDFDNDTPYTLTANNDGVLDASGNPDNCLRVSGSGGADIIQLEIDLGEPKDITAMTFDWWFDAQATIVVYVWVDGTNISQYLTMQGNTNFWNPDVMPLLTNLNGQVITIHMAAASPATDFRIDNIQITTL